FPAHTRPHFTGRRALGPGASAWLVAAACFCVACGDDDASAPEADAVSAAPDASVRTLPGDGREPTPEFDIDSRQREPIGPQVLVETLDDIRNGRVPGTGGDGSPDASPGPEADAGSAPDGSL